MRGLKAGLVIVVVFAAIIAGTYFARTILAEWAIRQVMASQGLQNPQVSVTALTQDGIRLEDISAGPGGAEHFLIAQIEADYQLATLLTERRINSLTIGPGRIDVRVSDGGRIEIAGVSPDQIGGGNAGGSSALPFEKLTLQDIALDIETPEGSATGTLQAVYDLAGEGSASLSLRAPQAGSAGLIAQDATIDIDTRLAQNGMVRVRGNLSGDFTSVYGSIRNARLSLNGEGSSWQDLASGDRDKFVGTLQLSLDRAEMVTGDVAIVDTMNANPALFGGPFDEVMLGGDLLLAVDAGDVVIEAGNRPLAIEAADGARASLSAALGEPFYMRRNGKGVIAGIVGVRGGEISATANITAEEMDTGWRFHLPVRIGDFEADALALNATSALISGVVSDARALIDVTANGTLRRARLGRFAIRDAPAMISFSADIDRELQTAMITLPTDNCAALERMSLKITGQDADASLKGARFCASDTPLAMLNFRDEMVTDFAARLSAKNATYRLGETKFVARPPTLDFTGRYEPALNTTRVQGSAKGGDVVFNDLMRFQNVDAALTFSLEKEVMRIGADVARMNISEIREPALIAPAVASGSFRLAGDKASFDYALKTSNGTPIGSGTGTHNIATAKGAAGFDIERLTFVPRGLQPEDLAPVLRGIIGTTGGAMDGRAQFEWTEGAVTSTADVSFQSLTFEGPGLTVTKTIGVNGDVSFASLWPIATSGAQTITVDGVDFGALQLEDGEIIFDMPGDETLVVERALFPWFGGSIGVRDARAQFVGGEALASLRVEGVDLKQVLEFVDVEGLSGEGVLDGVLPLQVDGGRAEFVDGKLSSRGAGAIRYVGNTASQAAQAGSEARIAFDILRDLQYKSLEVTVNGPLDGRLDFLIQFDGTGVVTVNQASGRVPVKYNITLDAALLELLNQANVSRNLELQIQQAVDGAQ